MCNNMKPSRLAESDKMDEVAVPEQQLAADDGTDDDMPGLEPVEEESWPVEEESKRRAGGKEIKLGVKEPARRGDSDETVWSCACTLAPKQCRCGIDAVQQDLCIERLNSLLSKAHLGQFYRATPAGERSDEAYHMLHHPKVCTTRRAPEPRGLNDMLKDVHVELKSSRLDDRVAKRLIKGGMDITKPLDL